MEYMLQYILQSMQTNGVEKMQLNVRDLVDKKFSHVTGKYAGQANISQFAKAVGIERLAALKIYNGETASISFEILESICRVLNCTPNDIIISEDPTVSRLLLIADKIQRDEENNKEKDDSE